MEGFRVSQWDGCGCTVPGPVGPEGPIGPVGPQGPQGVQGPAGTVDGSLYVAESGGNLGSYLGVGGANLGWPLTVRTGADSNFGFYGGAAFGCINNAGTGWQPITTPSSLTAGGDITAQGNLWTGVTLYFRGNGGLYLTHDGGSTFVVSQNFQAYGNVTCYAINSQGNTITGGTITANNPSNSSHFNLYNTETGHLRYIRMQAGDIDFVNNGYSASGAVLYNSGIAARSI